MATTAVNFGPNGIEDMITLDNLTEENLLKNLKIRYDKNLIYTFMGSILVSVNPYKLLPIYTNDVVRKYVGKRLGLEPPHIFAIADASYRHMREHTRNQGIIISGESGSGKTEATKLILQYFAAMTNRHSEIEQMILQSSPILEAFGNAKTVRNNNSSRFGKLIEIHFDQAGYIMGARITQYLLEKSRIPYQAPNERNYHIFYQFLAGCTDEEKARYKLKEASKFRYLNQSGCIDIPGMDDESNFNKTKIAMTFLGISEEAQAVLFSVLAAVLHVGNVEFRAEGEGSAIKNLESVKAAADLLALKADDLARALVTRSLTVRGTTTVIPLNVQQASDTRDALAKAIYSRLFEWLVARINKAVVKPNSRAFIAVLDIFGFENFKVNSFEQLCINYTNEKLQLHFNEHIFKIEQEEYAREKISWSKVDFKDNAECIALIERVGAPAGLIALLDEECRFPKATDATFLDKISAQHKDSKNFERAKNARTSFVVKHYAGDVAYEVKDFLDKNRDTMQPDLLAVINASRHDLVRAMFQNTVSADDTSKKNVTVGGNFRNQLSQLMQILESTNTFYVRCIKPNMAQVSDQFDMEMVMAQLRYAGVLETVKIRKSGYPVRFTLQDFAQRYRLLCTAVGTSRDWKVNCDRILQSLPQLQAGAWQVGLTKVFLRDYTSAALEDMRNSRMLKQVIRIQSWWRMIVLRLFYLHARGACITIQRHIRGYQQRRRYRAARAATIALQAAARMIITRPKQAERMRKKRDEIRRRMEEEKARRAAEEERRRRDEEERRKQAKKDEERAEKEREKQRKDDEKRKKEEDKKAAKGGAQQTSPRADRDRAVTSPQQLSLLMPEDDELRLPQGSSRAGALSLTSVPSLILDGSAGPEMDVVSPGRLIKVALNKHKWVPFKQVSGITEVPDLITSDQIVVYPFQEYAQKNFRKGLQPKKSLVDTLTMRKKSATTGRGMDELLCFQKKPLDRPLLDRLPLNYMKPATDLSVNIINYVTSLNKDPFVDVGAILRRGVATEQLRDEIYCQVIRQTFKCPSRDITTRVWELLSFVCASFVPSQELRKYVASFLLANKLNADEPQVRTIADFCLRLLNRACYREQRRGYYRTSAPSQVELVALKQRASVPVTINLLDGRRFELQIDSAATANETIALLLKRLPLADASAFALYESFTYLQEPFTRLEKSLFIEELICDSLAKLDLVKATMSYSLFFKRKMYLNPRAPISDPVERELMYHQAVFEVNEGTLPVTESDIIRMAALRVQHDFGDVNSSGKNFAVESYIPKHLIKKRLAGAWMDMVRMEYQNLVGTSKAEAQSQLLTFASQLAFYGCTIFPVENTPQNVSRQLPSTFELMVNVDGLHFVRPENDMRTVFRSLFFTDVTVDYTMNSVKLVYQEGGQTTLAELLTKRGIEVYNLTQDYMYWLEAQSEWAVAKQDYEVSDSTLLNFKKGELIHVVDKDVGAEWFMGEIGDRHGLFPRSSVTVLLRPPPEALEPPKSEAETQASRKKPENKLLNKLKGQLAPSQPQRNSNRMSAVLRPPSTQPGSGQRASIRVSQQSQPVRASQFVAAGRGQGAPAGARPRWAAIEVDPAQFPFGAYADRNFRRPEEHAAAASTGATAGGGLVNTLKRGGTILRRDRATTASSMQELQMFSKDPIAAPLLASVKPELHKLAVECFRCVMKHMDDLPKGKAAPIEVVQFVINSGLLNKELRDEIYCQIIKQCTNNPALESLLKGWVLLSLTCGIFLPSDHLVKYVIAFLQENAKLAGIYLDIGNLAKLALEYIARVKENGGLTRQCPPSSQELDALSTGAQLGCVVFLPDKSSKTVDIDCATSVRELLLQLGELRELRGWAIFQTITAKNYYYSSVLKGTDNICDVLYRWETFVLPKGVEGDIDFQFAFKKHVFLRSDDDLQHPVAAQLLYHQIAEYVQKGRIKGQEDDYPLLAALSIAYEFGDYDSSKAQLVQNVLTENPSAFLPVQLVKQFKLKKKDKAAERDTQLGSDGTQTMKIMNMAGRGGTMLKGSASAFVQRVQQLYATIQPGTTRPQLATRYVNKCREFQFYGTSLFPVSYAVSRKDVRKVLLAISEEGLHLFAGDVKPFRSIRLDEIASYGAAKGSISVTSGNLANPALDTFVSEDAEAIAEALGAYSKSRLEAQLIATRRKTMRPSFF